MGYGTNITINQLLNAAKLLFIDNISMMKSTALEISTPEYQNLCRKTYVINSEDKIIECPFPKIASLHPLAEKILTYLEESNKPFSVYEISTEAAGLIGSYNSLTNTVKLPKLNYHPSVIHETTHLAMNIMYSSFAYPYPVSYANNILNYIHKYTVLLGIELFNAKLYGYNNKQEKAYIEAANKVYINIYKLIYNSSEVAPLGNIVDEIKYYNFEKPSNTLTKSEIIIAYNIISMLNYYNFGEYDIELVVRYPEFLVDDKIENEAVMSLFAPIAEYYDRYIIPNLEQGI